MTTMTPTYISQDERITIAPSFVPECIRCRHKTLLCIIMPYGTDFAGSYICPDCLHELVDPAIMITINGRRNAK